MEDRLSLNKLLYYYNCELKIYKIKLIVLKAQQYKDCLTVRPYTFMFLSKILFKYKLTKGNWNINHNFHVYVVKRQDIIISSV